LRRICRRRRGLHAGRRRERKGRRRGLHRRHRGLHHRPEEGEEEAPSGPPPPAGGRRGRGAIGASIAAVVGVGRKRVGRKRQREEGSDCAREGGRDRGRKRVGRPAAPKTLSSYIYV